MAGQDGAVSRFLTVLRLTKYNSVLQHLLPSQLAVLTDAELAGLGLPLGVQGRGHGMCFQVFKYHANMQ